MTPPFLRRWLGAAAVYREPRVLAILFLGFSSGLPLALTFSTLSIWLAEAGVSKTTIGLFAALGTPYTLKFLWAPLVDRLPLPVLTRRFGRRRGWLLLTQFGLMASLVALGATDPAVAPGLTALCAFLVAFASASQDIVIDAYRVEILEERQQGAGAALIVLGYRVGMLASGAGALFLASAVGWFTVYAVMAALVLVGVVTVLLNPEPAVSAPPRAGGAPGGKEQPRRPLGDAWRWLREAVIDPFADFMGRQGWVVILLFITFYKFGDALAGVMTNPFLVDIGFSKAEIASVVKTFGLGATLVGAVLGGALLNGVGIYSALWICGLLQMVSNLAFAVQAWVGHDLAVLTLTIALENLASGMGTAAFVAYLSRLCNVAYTATQYALLSSFMAAARTWLASSGGWLADQMSWVGFFAFTTAAAVPGLMLLWWLTRGPGLPSPVLQRPAPRT